MKQKGWKKLGAYCLGFALLCGCSNEQVDYDLNQKEENKEVTSSLQQFWGEDSWKDEWILKNEEGKEVTIDVNATIVVPEGESMSVLNVEKVSMDANYKKQFLENYFEESPIYNLDVEFQIDEDATVGEVDGSYVLYQYESLVLQEPEKYKKEMNTYEVASNFDKNSYIGIRNGIAYVVMFFPDENAVTIIPTECCGPKETKNCDSYERSYTEMWSEKANKCELSLEDAQNIAEKFLSKIGCNNFICNEVNSIVWTGYEESADGKFHEQDNIIDGYCFEYTPGVNGVCINNYFSSIRIDVTEEGITKFWLIEPFSVVSEAKQVELLPLSTIKDIIKNELTENIKEYSIMENQTASWLELTYVLIQEEGSNSYSYVPAWILELNGKSGYISPIEVNAIDGSIIYE